MPPTGDQEFDPNNINEAGLEPHFARVKLKADLVRSTFMRVNAIQ